MIPKIFRRNNYILNRFKTRYYLIIPIINIIFFMVNLVLLKIFFIYTNTVNDTENNYHNESIDVVYTWVNGSDEDFLKSLKRELKKAKFKTYPRDSYTNNRFDDNDELKYSLRSLEIFAPWIRHVYIVTNGQVPNWLDLSYEKVTLVTHEQIFEDKNDLPTFSSCAIESQIHRIPGLSKRFLYFNDDVFLGDHIFPEDFYTPNNGFIIYLGIPVPVCSPGCNWSQIGDKKCDPECNNAYCDFDKQDCWLQILSPLQNKINSTSKIKSNITIGSSFVLSLIHTNRILNKRYGYQDRFMAQHIPIMLDKDILEELHTTFRNEMKVTASNKLRFIDDFQLQFGYYYFLMGETKKNTVEEIFNYYDTDSSSSWCSKEIRTAMVHLLNIPLQQDKIAKFDSLVLKCATDLKIPVEIKNKTDYEDTSLVSVSKNLIMQCKKLKKLLLKRWSKASKYKYTVEHDAIHFTFVMLDSNLRNSLRQMDRLRKNQSKFVCINNDMDDMDITQNLGIRKIVTYSLEFLYPFPSKFELAIVTSDERRREEQIKMREKIVDIIFYLVILIVYVLMNIFLFLRIVGCVLRKIKKY